MMITADDEWKILDIFRASKKPLSKDQLKIKCYNEYKWPTVSIRAMNIVEKLVREGRLKLMPPDYETGDGIRKWSTP